MGPELALAIDGCVTESTALIVSLIKKVYQVRQLKKKCESLGKQAKILVHLLDKNRAAITSFQSLGQFTVCLNRIDTFVSAINQSSLFDRTVEVFWNHEYQSLTKCITSVKEIFVVESVAEILSREDNISGKLGDVLKLQGEQKDILLYLQKSTQLIEKKRAEKFSSASILGLKTDFEPKDFVSSSFKSDDASIKRGTIDGVGKVICYKIALTSSMPEFLMIYKNIQSGAYVQRLYGTVKLQDDYYVVMQDLDDNQTLAAACQDGGLPDTPLSRISLAYDLAKTMAWYHHAQLLLKSVSDHTVVLQQLNSGRLAPFLTKLQNARHILEKTTGLTYDVRYEAPEFDRLREHSKYTDIWSLGVIMWQCLTGKVPYGISTMVQAEDQNFATVRKALNESSLPGELDGTDLSSFGNARDLILQCWNRDPWLRPTAASAADILLDLRVQFSTSTSDPPTHKAGEPKQSLESATATSVGDKGSSQTTDQVPASVITADEPDGKTSSLGKTAQVFEVMEEICLAAIKQARELNDKKPTYQQSEKSVSKEQFQLLFEKDTERSPAENFMVGAVIYWNLCEDIQEIVSATQTGLVLSAEGTRALASLTYLQSAVETGYMEAYLELYKVHASLAREFRSRVPTTQKAKEA